MDQLRSYVTNNNKKHYPKINPPKKLVVEYPSILKGNEEKSLEYVRMFSSTRRSYTLRTYSRGKTFLPNVASVLKKYKLPEELKLLLALESDYDSNAVSCKGAVGYWQIMDAVAEEFGLKYTKQPSEKVLREIFNNNNKRDSFLRKLSSDQDERRNFMKSTHVAARYLKDRFRNLSNNILLVVASYNLGVGNIWKCMKKSGKADPTFWDIKKYLPAETTVYVMNFIALNVLFNNYDNFPPTP